jgi:hypothetical protein
MPLNTVITIDSVPFITDEKRKSPSADVDTWNYKIHSSTKAENTDNHVAFLKFPIDYRVSWPL